MVCVSRTTVWTSLLCVCVCCSVSSSAAHADKVQSLWGSGGHPSSPSGLSETPWTGTPPDDDPGPPVWAGLNKHQPLHHHPPPLETQLRSTSAAAAEKERKSWGGLNYAFAVKILTSMQTCNKYLYSQQQCLI